MKRCLIITLLLFTLIPLHAEWSIGVTGGATYNSLSGSPQYAYDLRSSAAWGWNAGIAGQYTFNQWLGAGAELLYITKNHSQHRGPLFSKDWGFTERNGYLQLPVMAKFSFGPAWLHGFLNAGMAFGWWTSRYRTGHELSLSPDETSEFSSPVKYSQRIPFDSRRDRRFDVSPFAGIGIGWSPIQNWEIQAEARLYYGVTSITKRYQGLKDPRYNTTTSLAITLLRKF